MAKILVTMPDSFLSKVDGIAGDQHQTRSELIREALRSYMRKVSLHQSKKADENARILENLLG